MESEKLPDLSPAEKLQQWWIATQFDGKENYTLAEDGALTLNGGTAAEQRAVATLSLETADATVKALQEKYREAQTRVTELAEEWAGADDKLKLSGKVMRMREYLAHANMIGNPAPLHQQVGEWDKSIQALIDANYNARLALVTKAEELTKTDNWKEVTTALRETAEEWKNIGFTDKKRSDELWDRLEAAKNAFFDRKRQHQEDQEKELMQNLDLKMELVDKAENLAASEKWKDTTEQFRQLMDEWKATGRTVADKNEALWQRFIAARNNFFDRKKVHFEQIQTEQEANYLKKVALAEQAEGMSGSTDWNKTSNAFATLMDQWKAIGRVPLEKADELWERLNKAKEQFFGARRQHQETTRVGLEDNYAQKMALIKRAQELAHSTQWREATDELNELMDEWKKIGPVPREHSTSLWETFLDARRGFFNAKDADRDRRKVQHKNQLNQRSEQTRQFLNKLQEELDDEVAKLADFREGISKLTTGPKEEELRQHLTRLIGQTEAAVQRRQNKIDEVTVQMKELETRNRHDRDRNKDGHANGAKHKAAAAKAEEVLPVATSEAPPAEEETPAVTTPVAEQAPEVADAPPPSDVARDTVDTPAEEQP